MVFRFVYEPESIKNAIMRAHGAQQFQVLIDSLVKDVVDLFANVGAQAEKFAVYPV